MAKRIVVYRVRCVLADGAEPPAHTSVMDALVVGMERAPKEEGLTAIVEMGVEREAEPIGILRLPPRRKPKQQAPS
jgi:hypothetical protein